MSEQEPNPGFIKRLIDARVIQTLAIYIPVGWIMTEIATQATETFGLPYWVPGGAMALFIAGIPVTAFLAWAFQITKDGIRLEVASLKGGLAITISISLMLGGSAILFQRIEPAPDPDIDRAGIAHYGAVTTKPVTSIAVMPFEASSDSRLGQVFSGEISERLAKHADLYVVSAAAIDAPTLAALGPIPKQKALKSEHLLTGSIRTEGDAFSLKLLLQNDADQTVWQDDFLFGRDAESQRSLQRRVAQELSTILGTKTPSAEFCDPSGNLTALENYHEARVLNNKKGPENLARGEELLRQAIALDPEYGRAYSALTINLLLQRRGGGGLLGDLARKALNLCPTLGAAYKIWVPRYEGISNQWIDQELQWRDALAMEPNHLWMLDNYAMHLGRAGRGEQVFAVDERSYRNYPLDPRAVVSFGWDHFFLKDYDKARDLAQRARDLGDESCNYQMLTYVIELQSSSTLESVRQAFRNIPQRCKDVQMGHLKNTDPDLVYLSKFDPAKRREYLDYLESVIEDYPNSAFVAGIDLGAPNLVFLAVDVAMKNHQRLHLAALWTQTDGAKLIRRDPRFIDLVKELGLDEYWREFGWPWNGMCTPFGDSFVCDN